MALLLRNDEYLKIDTDGNYIIYQDKTQRTAQKRAISSTKVIAKYNEILKSYNITAEVAYYSPKVVDEFSAWHNEFINYCNDLAKYQPGHYPLMEQYYASVDKSIPKVIAKGQVGVPKNATLEEVYNFIKEYNIFGTNEEVKDI